MNVRTIEIGLAVLVGAGWMLYVYQHQRASRTPLTVEEIIERNTTAMGGRVAIEAVKSVEVSLHIKDPGSEVDGIYHAARPGRMRIDIFTHGSRVFMERFDGEKGWQWNGNEEREENATATAALRHGIELPGILFGLHEMQKRGNRIQLARQENIDRRDYYVLHVMFADGYETSLFIDARTWLITRRRDVRALHPDIDPTPMAIESRKLEWRKVNGVYFAFADEDLDLKTGKVLETAQIKEIKVNVPIDPSIFERL
jgi:hypothetical protein